MAVNDAILCLNSNLKQKRILIVCILIDQPHTACKWKYLQFFSLCFLADVCLHCGSSLSNFTCYSHADQRITIP